jgi:OHCU decarboxylase
MPCSLTELGSCDLSRFVEVCGPLYEHSPWVAQRAFARRPFTSLPDLHAALTEAVASATLDEQIALIRAHPDLVGNAARAGRLTAASQGEQAAAGLGDLDESEIALFEQYNAAYRDRFGFPFVICARENRKDAILAAFPVRLAHTPEDERATALAEIQRIGWLRLVDAVSENSLSEPSA